jgi:hypothetical protein
VLWNRLALRIARKEIVVNEQNNRGECEANNAEVTEYASSNLRPSEHQGPKL